MDCDWLKCRDCSGHYFYQMKHCKTSQNRPSMHSKYSTTHPTARLAAGKGEGTWQQNVCKEIRERRSCHLLPTQASASRALLS